MKLYSYWRSSASYRVRIALALKNIVHEPVCIHLVRDGGQQYGAGYLAKNPQGQVPSLELDDGTVIVQSMAILEYLDEVFPKLPLIFGDPVQRAQMRAIAQMIACDIHPHNNLRVMAYLKKQLGHSQDTVNQWYAHWVRKGGLEAVEAMLETVGIGGPFAFGDQPGLADLAIVPQAYNARRFNVPLDDLPNISRIEKAALAHPAFQQAFPDNQDDAELTV